MSHCIACDLPITPDNDSDEHVIQNSVGGKLTVRGFLHSHCNSILGATWDAEFAQQTNPFCLFFQIVRDRGVSPSIKVSTTAGESLILHADGGLAMAKPSYSVTQTEKGLALNFTARTMREARQMLSDAKEKYPSIDVDKMLAEVSVSETPPQGAIMLNFQIGGTMASRSIVKTAAAFAHHCGIDSRTCELAAKYLRDKTAEPPFGYFDETDLVLNRQPEIPLHCVAVSGDPKTGLLLSYIEYFGLTRIIVCLSENYRGAPMHKSYGINPLTGETMDVSVGPLTFSKADLESIYRYERISSEQQMRIAKPIFDAAMRRKFEIEKTRASNNAMEYALKNCGANEGDLLTEEHMKRIGALFAEKMRPFILRHLHRPSPRPPISGAVSDVHDTSSP